MNQGSTNKGTYLMNGGHAIDLMMPTASGTTAATKQKKGKSKSMAKESIKMA